MKLGAYVRAIVLMGAPTVLSGTYATDPEVLEGGGRQALLELRHKSVQALWEKELPGAIEKADRNWPGVLEKPAR